MWLDVFNANPYGTNCWLLASDGSDEAVVVDPGFAPARVHGLLDARGKTPVAVLATHAHVDHVGQAGDFAGETPRVRARGRRRRRSPTRAAWGAGIRQPARAR